MDSEQIAQHEVLDRLKDKALSDIIAAVDPFMVRSNTGAPRPLPIKIQNDTQQALHLVVEIVNNVVVITAQFRVPNPDDTVVVIPSSESKEFDLTKR